MRLVGFSIGHRLPGGFMARAYFSAYNPRRIDSTTLIHGGSAGPSPFVVVLQLGFFAVIMTLMIYGLQFSARP